MLGAVRVRDVRDVRDTRAGFAGSDGWTLRSADPFRRVLSSPFRSCPHSPPLHLGKESRHSEKLQRDSPIPGRQYQMPPPHAEPRAEIAFPRELAGERSSNRRRSLPSRLSSARTLEVTHFPSRAGIRAPPLPRRKAEDAFHREAPGHLGESHDEEHFPRDPHRRAGGRRVRVPSRGPGRPHAAGQGIHDGAGGVPPPHAVAAQQEDPPVRCARQRCDESRGWRSCGRSPAARGDAFMSLTGARSFPAPQREFCAEGG